ncbi:MAG: hypothetical protein K2H67_06430, partial [Treponemataceae bacterium]|nr:hypothetical protein [Treponemataceae bacterium]
MKHRLKRTLNSNRFIPEWSRMRRKRTLRFHGFRDSFL